MFFFLFSFFNRSAISGTSSSTNIISSSGRPVSLNAQRTKLLSLFDKNKTYFLDKINVFSPLMAATDETSAVTFTSLLPSTATRFLK